MAVALLERSGAGHGLGWIDEQRCDELLADVPSDITVVVKAHRPAQLPGATEAIQSGVATAIYVYRDIRDVVTSLLSFEPGVFHDYVNRGVMEELLEDDRYWSAQPGALISRYESMVLDLAGEAKRIGTHLDLALASETMEEIAAEHSFDRQVERMKAPSAHTVHASGTYDPATLLHPNHLRSGVVGQWAELPSLDVAYIEKVTGAWLAEHDYPLSQPTLTRRLAAARYLTRFPVRAWRHTRHGTLWHAIRRRLIRHPVAS
jgi:hypothetical protein